MEQILVLRKMLSRIPNINKGGCGVAAHVLYHASLKYGIRFRIFMGYNNIIEYDMAVNSVVRNQPPEYLHHVFLKDDKERVFDARGSFFVDAYKYHLEISAGYLAMLLDQPIWNSDFEREKYIFQIEEFSGVSIGTKLHITQPDTICF